MVSASTVSLRPSKVAALLSSLRAPLVSTRSSGLVSTRWSRRRALLSHALPPLRASIGSPPLCCGPRCCAPHRSLLHSIHCSAASALLTPSSLPPHSLLAEAPHSLLAASSSSSSQRERALQRVRAAKRERCRERVPLPRVRCRERVPMPRVRSLHLVKVDDFLTGAMHVEHARQVESDALHVIHVVEQLLHLLLLVEICLRGQLGGVG